MREGNALDDGFSEAVSAEVLSYKSRIRPREPYPCGRAAPAGIQGASRGFWRPQLWTSAILFTDGIFAGTSPAGLHRPRQNASEGRF
jgi:hypothetical protein